MKILFCSVVLGFMGCASAQVDPSLFRESLDFCESSSIDIFSAGTLKPPKGFVFVEKQSVRDKYSSGWRRIILRKDGVDIALERYPEVDADQRKRIELVTGIPAQVSAGRGSCSVRLETTEPHVFALIVADEFNGMHSAMRLFRDPEASQSIRAVWSSQVEESNVSIAFASLMISPATDGRFVVQARASMNDLISIAD